MTIEQLSLLLGYVNAIAFCGKPAETLLIAGFSDVKYILHPDGSKALYAVCEIKENKRGWNDVFNGKEYLRVEDADGKPMYPSCYFRTPSADLAYRLTEWEYEPLNVAVCKSDEPKILEANR